MTSPATSSWWVGTYPAAGAGTPPGRGEGIWRVDLEAPGRLGRPDQVVVTPAPTFLATHPGGRVLYACAETDTGTVTAFAVTDDGGLTPVGVVDSGGAFPCHLLLSPDARTLYVANYGSGTLGVLPLDVDGGFAPATLAGDRPVQVLGHAGSGPRADRQDGPHAHFVASVPDGWLLVADLGTDDLRRYRVRPDGLLAEHGVAVHLPPGTGPRHLAVGGLAGARGPMLYLAAELMDAVQVLRWHPDAGTAEVVQTVATTTTPVTAASATDAADGPLPSHVVMDGGHLVVAVRGPDVLVDFPVDPGTGLLGAPTEVPTGGAWPRHLALADGIALVANQGSGDVAVVQLRGDGAGLLDRARVPAAACVVPRV